MPNVSNFGAQTDNAVVQGTVTDRAMVIPDIPPSGLMSVGPRVTPHFVKPSLWSALTTYHFFDAVHDAAGASYVAIKPEVPAGTELTDERCWFLWADPNSQFADLSELVKTFNGRIVQNTNDITTKAPNNHASEETTYGVGNEVNYGHVRLATDDTPLTSGANEGVAATPKMTSAIYNNKPGAVAAEIGDGSTTAFSDLTDVTNITSSNFTAFNAKGSNDTGYGLIVGAQKTAQSSNARILFSNLISKLGQRARTNDGKTTKGIDFIGNSIQTTGNTEDSVGIEHWAPNGTIALNRITGDNQTGYSGITSANSNHSIIGNIIEGFFNSFEVTGDYNTVLGNIGSKSKNAIYNGNPASKFGLFVGNIFHDVDCAINASAGGYTDVCVISDCIFDIKPDSTDATIYTRNFSGEIVFNNCVFNNINSFDVQQKLTFNDCKFYAQSNTTISLPSICKVSNCTFKNIQLMVSGTSVFKTSNCEFDIAGFTYNIPVLASSGSSPILVMNNITTTSDKSPMKVFTDFPTAEFGVYSGGVFNNIFYTYNQAAPNETEHFKTLFKDTQEVVMCYDTYLHQFKKYINGALV